MPGLDYAIQNLGAQGLSAATQLNQISDTYVGIWNLESTSSSVPENVEFRPSKGLRTSNRIGGTDDRQLVADTDVAPGGKYRSIVKLFLRYAGQKESDPWIIATGWLIAPDVIVTAGHSAFDWFYKGGRLTQVKAYVGYNGRASAQDPTLSVQFQQGSQVATTAEWLRSKGVRAYNLAFIKVQQPFTEIEPIRYEHTPRSGRSSLGVVGYAGDIADQATGEKGARIYESFANTSWDLEDSEYSMLEYDIDSSGANSGSPVLRKEDLVSIGTHVYGGSPSSASVIGLGSLYEDYVAAFSVEPRRSQKQADSIKYVHISVIGSVQQTSSTAEQTSSTMEQASSTAQEDLSTPQQASSTTQQELSIPQPAPNIIQQNQDQTWGFGQLDQSGNGKGYPNAAFESYQYNDAIPPTNQDSTVSQNGDSKTYSKNVWNGNQPNQSSTGIDWEFFEILKVGIKLSDPVLSNILQVHLPMVLGSVGSPVGALAGAILSAAGKLATQSSSPVNSFRQGLPYDGVLERAVLGEAAFSAVMLTKRRKLEELGVFSEMAKVVKQIAPAAKEIAPFIMHTLTAPALRIALYTLHTNANGPSAKSSTGVPTETPFAQQTSSSSENLDPDAEAFFKRLSASIVNSNGSENSSRSVERILHVGFREAGPVLTGDAYEGLQLLAEILPDNPSGGEGIPGHHPFIDGLPERAILGEAALQALIKVRAERLDDSAFEVMAQSVARNGPVVLESAHGLIEDIGFAVKGILAIQDIGADGTVEESNGTVKGSNGTITSASRRDKGVSYINLEREVLDYYRGLETSLQPALEFR